MTHMKTLIVTVAMAWLVGACAGGLSTEEKQTAYEQTLAAAESAYNKALSVGFAWTNSEELLKAAREAAGKGELDKATSLARESRTMSELAYNQYLEQKDAGEIGIR